MTLLDFSSMTPIRIQVLYCESITNMRTSPISEVVCVAPLDCSELEAVHRERPRPSQLRGLRRREMGRLDRLDDAEVLGDGVYELGRRRDVC